MYNGVHHCVPLVEVVKKHIWNIQFGVRMRVMPLRKCMNYRYYRFEITGTTGPRRFSADMNYRYYWSETGTTDGGW
jgi:hypothetical protein